MKCFDVVVVTRVNFTISNASQVSGERLVLGHSATFQEATELPQPLRFPLSTEARQTLFAGEQFVHGTLLDIALFADEFLQRFDKRIRIAQRLCYGFLLGLGGW